MNLLHNKLPLVLLLLLTCVPGAAASTVVRSITQNNTASPIVVITATPDAAVSAYAVQDQLPIGLTPANITEGGLWDGVNRMVKWGPFDTNLTALTLSYTVTGSPGTYTVSGVGSFDGVSVPTTGSNQIVITAVSTVVRTITGGTNVTLVVTPAAGVSAYAVQDTLPTGVAPANITQGGTWDAANLMVKWGPFFGNAAVTLSYTVTGNPGTYIVSGLGSFDGVPVPATGNSQIVISGLPVITNPPQSQAAFAGSNVIFSIGATGLAPLQYEWRFNGAQIAGATNSSYTVSSAQLSDQGIYGASVFNGVGLTDATNFELVVLLPPTNATVGVGASATFSVVESNAPPLSFQWSFDGGAISGATNTNYTVADLQFTNQGIYTVVVTGVGAPASASATLTVTNGPPVPSTVVRTITAGTNVTLVATPAPTVSAYAVQENLPAGLTPANISPGGVWDAVNRMVKWGPFDTNITAQTLSYTVAGNQGTYTVSGVGSFDGVSVTTTGDTNVVIVGHLVRPGFILQPVSQVVSLGQSVTFTAGATGSPPPSYQWQINGVNISGATGASYNIPSAGLGNIGLYDVVIANSGGSTTSSVVSLGFLDLKLLAAVYLTGPIGSTYDIEAASALAPTNWITVTTVTITNQPFIWVDYSSATNAQQFYRAVPQ
jgi:hypothetical protein